MSARDDSNFLKDLGPGLITGVSDDDPSGIVTYSQSGALFGLNTLWLLLFVYPFICTMQLISAEIGRVSGKGLAKNLKLFFPKYILYPLILMLVVANTINIGADISAMAEVSKMLVGGPSLLYAVLIAGISILCEIYIPYHRYVKYLKWLTLALLSYVVSMFFVEIPWSDTLRATFVPHLSLDKDFLKMLIAVLGTTISPYLFFWQASEEVEELNLNPREKKLINHPELAARQLKRIRFDTFFGMACSNSVAYFIILTCAVTLHAKGITQIQSATEAAHALEPIVGKFCYLLFSLGILGTGFLAIPVLAASSAYALAETFNHPYGLEKKFSDAKVFYSFIAASIVVGLCMIFLGVNPIRALVWSAVINGIVAVPLIGALVLMASSKKVMGAFVLSLRMKIMGLVTFVIMLLAALGYIFVGA